MDGPSFRLLLVEDDPLLAMDMADQLIRAGFSIVGPATSSPRAIEYLKSEGCNIAILDVNLGDHTSEPVAEALRDATIPFITVTAYSPEQIAPIYREGAVLRKPAFMSQLLQEIYKLT